MSSFFTKIAKIRIEGPINLQIQHDVIKIINKLNPSRLSALAVIINSYGGSFRSAKVISDCLMKFRDQKEMPIYCFAEDFCLNSANLILTAGTKSFANKLSMVGDFGYVADAVDYDDFQKQYKVGEIQISQMKKKKIKNGPFFTLNINDKNLLTYMVNQNAKQLREGIIKNRLNAIKMKNQTISKFEQLIYSKSIVEPYKAVQCGLIDEVSSFEAFNKKNYNNAKTDEKNQKIFESPKMNWLYEAHKMLGKAKQ